MTTRNIPGCGHNHQNFPLFFIAIKTIFKIYGLVVDVQIASERRWFINSRRNGSDRPPFFFMTKPVTRSYQTVYQIDPATYSKQGE